MNFWTFSLILAIILRLVWTDPATLYLWVVFIVLYTIVNFFLDSQKPNSFRRKFNIATWSSPSEPNLYLREEIDYGRIEQFMDKYNTENPNNKITATAVFAKALGMTMAKTTKTYGKISFGQYIAIEEVNISVAVDIQGENVGFVLLKACNTNTISALANQLSQHVRKLKEKKDKNFNNQVNIFKRMPSFIIQALVRILTYVNYDLGLSLGFLKMGKEAFGCAILTNVSSWEINDVHAPLVPVCKSIIVSLMNKPKMRAVVENGEIVIKKMMYFNSTFDHRFADGHDADRMIKTLHEVLKNPELYQ